MIAAMNEKNLMPFCILFAIYASSMVICTLQGAKIINVMGLIFPGGYFAASITYACTDITGEIYGKKFAQNMVTSTIIALCIVLLLIQIDIAFPAADFWELEQSYNDILGFGPRLIMAVIAAIIVGQYLDIYLFDKINTATNGKHLWLRNNGSTAISKLFDACTFNFVAFYGIYDVITLIQMTGAAYIFYVTIALLDTPFVYAAIWSIKKTHSKKMERA